MMGRGKRRCIRGITSSWPAAAAFQAAVVLILPSFCLPSPNCASLRHCAVRTLVGEGHWWHREVVPVVTPAPDTDAPLAPSPGQQVHSTQNCLLLHPLFLGAQQRSLRMALPEAGVF